LSELAERVRELFTGYAERPREPKTIYVTDLTGCLRKAFYEIYFRANPPPTGPMVAGRLLHGMLGEVLLRDEEFGGDAEFEVSCVEELDGGWRLKGKADVVGSEAVYEFKFTRGIHFNRAEPAYVAQVSAYCFMLGKTKGYLVLVDRDSFDVKVFEVEPDEDLWRNMVQEAKVLVECVGRAEAPTLNSPRMGFECKNCVWRIVCDLSKKVGEVKGEVEPGQPVQ
jgi:hypothetical protein